jgi:hypothetical protein
MVTLVLVVAAVAVPFCSVLVVANTLLAVCAPKTWLAAVACFVVPSLAVLAGLVAWGSAIAAWLHPIFWHLAWPTLALACIGIVGAGFAVAAFRRRQLRSMHDAIATPTI